MVTLHSTHNILIQMPGEEIFTYISDLENLVAWSDVTIAVKKISPEGIYPGARAQSIIRFLGKCLTMTFEIVEYEPGHYLSIKSTTGVAPCLFCYQIGPCHNGLTTLSQEVTIHLSEGLVDLTIPTLTGEIHRQIEHDLHTLKGILETRSLMNDITTSP